MTATRRRRARSVAANQATSADRRLEIVEAGNISAGTRQFGTKPLPTGSDTQVKTTGMECVAFSVADTTEFVETKITSGRARPFLRPRCACVRCFRR